MCSSIDCITAAGDRFVAQLGAACSPEAACAALVQELRSLSQQINAVWGQLQVGPVRRIDVEVCAGNVVVRVGEKSSLLLAAALHTLLWLPCLIFFFACRWCYVTAR